MAKRFWQFTLLALICLTVPAVVTAQVLTVGKLVGTVSDQTGAVVAGADITVKDESTGAVLETKSGADGGFVFANLKGGSYTVTVKLQGFQTGEFRNVKITVGGTYDLQAKMEVGQIESTVVVEAGAEVLETSSTSIGMVVTGRMITQLPQTSRDTNDLALLVPGASTAGRPRNTAINGLPKGAINITLDGINAQDNNNKSSDGFFTLIRPKIDAIEEFSISTAGQGAEQAAEGAVQIRLETKRGTNEYHGGVWWQHRNDWLNANYFYSNQSGTLRQRQRLNQYGYKVGGPIWKDRIFFFSAMDTYRNPGSRFRERTMLTPEAIGGAYRYTTLAAFTTTAAAPLQAWMNCGPTMGPGFVGTVAVGTSCATTLLGATGLIQVAGAGAIANNALDPFVSTVLAELLLTATAPGVTPRSGSPFQDIYAFNNRADQTRRFPDNRFDWNITKNLQWSGVYHYHFFTSTPDTLNSRDPVYLTGRFLNNIGSQISNRNQWSTSLRWNVAANMSNNFTFGLVVPPVSFFPDVDNTIYPISMNNLGSIRITPAIGAGLISNPWFAFGAFPRSTKLEQFNDNFGWTRGKHSMSFGMSWTQVRAINVTDNFQAHGATLGLSSVDPAAALFTAARLPGSDATLRAQAGALYAMLTGRVSAYGGAIAVDAATRQYVPGSKLVTRNNQREWGIYGTDSWRLRPNLTFNYGLRWEVQNSPFDPDNTSYRPVGGFEAGVFGVTGSLSNLFNPSSSLGVLPGIPAYELNGAGGWYNTEYNNFAPSIGLAYSPSFDNKWWTTVFGGPGKTVFRGGYSISFTREGTANFSSIAFANPGQTGSISASVIAPPGGVCPAAPFVTAGQFPAGCLTLDRLINAGDLQSLLISPAAFVDTGGSFQIRPFAGQSVNMFSPDLAVPLVQSWSFGVQREITPNLVVEVRYVGNHGTGLWRQDNINEVNIFENGFLTEFNNARSNLAICRATAGCIVRFSNQGLPGQVAVPIFTAAFTGVTTGVQTNANFASATFITPLDNGGAGSAAGALAGSSTFMCNLAGSAAWQGTLATNPCPAAAPLLGAFPINFFVANPHATSGAFRMYNGSHSTYNGLQIEVRQRVHKGLQFNGNYSFAKGLSNAFADSGVNFAGFSSLRNPGRDKGPSAFDLRHTFKMAAIWDLPFGPGRRWSTGQGWLNRIIEGWQASTIMRWQSGIPFQLNGGLAGGATFNTADPGVQLIGITRDQLQRQLNIRTTTITLGNGTQLPAVFYFPASLVNVTVGTSSYTSTANTTFLRACSTPGQFCQRLFLNGPGFFTTALNIVKETRITERVKFEFRAEFLNAFNNINFYYPAASLNGGATSHSLRGAGSGSGSQFAQVTQAYQDISTTDDNGGRIIQLVLRINF